MAEIYLNESRFVYLDISGTDADAEPVATLKRTGSVDAALDVSEVLPTPTGLAQRWKAYVPLAEVDTTGDFKVVWTGTVGGEAFSHTQYYKVVIPYVTKDELSDRFGWQFTDPSSANYKDRDYVEAAESVVRSIIDVNANQTFGYEVKTVPATGKNTDVLTLPDKILAIKKIYEDDTLIYDATQDPVYNYKGYVYTLGDSRYSIRIVGESYELNEYEELKLITTKGRFESERRYDVYGDFGFEYVPNEIKEAAMLLVNDLLCQDSTYRIRYINHIQVKDWKFSFDPRTWTGTGNALVDDLLSKYKVQPVWVI